MPVILGRKGIQEAGSRVVRNNQILHSKEELSFF
jgi:hypothetical protein